MSNIVIVDDDLDNIEEVTATAQITDRLPIVKSHSQLITGQNTNQIKINILNTGDVEIENPYGKTYFIGKEILQEENIDTNDLTNDAIHLLLNMTAIPDQYYSYMPVPTLGSLSNQQQQQQGHQNFETLGLGSSNGSTPTDQTNRRKRNNKEIFDPSKIVKEKRNRITASTNSSIVDNERNLKLVPTHMDHTTNAFSASAPANSSIRPPVLAAQVLDLTKIRELTGVVIYKPDHQPQQSKNYRNYQRHRHHCIYCHKPIPKSKLDFVLVRLPIHIDCSGNDADTNIPVLSDLGEVENEEEK